MNIAEGLAILISSLSVIATVVGWRILYIQQKQIVRTQAQINEEKEKKDTKLKIMLARIDSAYSWLNEGHDLVLLSEKVDANTLKQRLMEWQLKYNKEIESSDLFYYNIPALGRIHQGNEVYKDVCNFYEYVVTVVNARAEGDETKALEKLTNGEYKTYEPDIVKADFDGFTILLPEGFWGDYIGSRMFFDRLRNELLK